MNPKSFTALGRVLGEGQLAADGEAEGTITFEVPKESTSLTFMFYANDEAMLKFKVKQSKVNKGSNHQVCL
ncbi:hypothetical protein [Clostridium sp. CF012]|uniref:hypothetical protein n=1 Tax=Clostridium sp. CF012 TaxID=2843319 RepID=UPI001C0C1356|nr:hypothetical protein [Clostridium sp. CF012]MBU3145649.1 hypothetical protein [Clostridium sp. CF012]